MKDRKRSRCFLGGGIGDTRDAAPEKGGTSSRSGRLRRKLADSGGLTLIEMLCATLILTLLCVMVSTGLSMAAYDYRMLTAEAETELLVNTITSALTDRLRDSTFSVKTDGTGAVIECSHSLGKVGIADGGPEAGKTKPAKDTVLTEKVKADGSTEQNALLPDGAYGAVYGENDTDGKQRRYKVVNVSVKMKDASGAELDLPPAGGTAYPVPGDIVTYTIALTVEDRITGVTGTTPEGGIVVRGLNPVKKIE